MVNPGEVPRRAVMFDQPKVLTGWNQKGTWPGAGTQRFPAAVVAPPAQRHDLTHADRAAERGKPVVLRELRRLGTQTARRADGTAGRG